MQANIDKLRAAVARQTSVVKSVATGYRELAKAMRQAADDPDEIRALADEVEANTKELANATLENTDQQNG
jgi:hypothetical protein